MVKITKLGKQELHGGMISFGRTKANTPSNSLLNLYTLAVWGLADAPHTTSSVPTVKSNDKAMAWYYNAMPGIYNANVTI